MVDRTSDVLVIGGGVVGLAIALELQQQGVSVTVLSRNFQEAASHAAAGMLAPHAEMLPPGPLLELCQRSLYQYSTWVQKLEALTGRSVGYWPCGILAPQFTPPPFDFPADAPAYRLDAAIHNYQVGLSPEVQGGWWFPEDGQIDNRALVQALRVAVQDLGIPVHEGVTVKALQQQRRRITQVITSAGEFTADQVVLATGAWSSDLVPVPVFPRKGQMAALRVPQNYAQPQPLQRVLYGESIYIVPRQDGRIVLGATSEDVGFTPGNTPVGVQQLLSSAMRLYPELAHFTLEECWWGFRPATPDEMPLLGQGPLENLILATGHYRNGILLTPITAHLVAQAVQGKFDPLLESFSWERFARPSSLADASPYTPTKSQLLPPSSLLPQPMQILDKQPQSTFQLAEDAPLIIAGRPFKSRLMTGTGKYDSFEVMRHSVAASGCEIVTVAVRRVQTNAPGHEGLAEALDWSKIWMLPNTAGCKTAEEAIRVARLGREMAKLLGQEDNNFVKLEVIPDGKYLLPDPIGTLEAAEQLVKEGFAVLPYINADPLLAKRLEEVGCATVMPLGSPIGSGQGIRNEANIQIIIENATVPVVVDAGIGAPSEAAQAMEMGASALLINTAIAKATNPIQMARAMGLAAEAGRLAYLAGRIPIQGTASASSPLTGRITE
ncbi:glycine oxidase ThiO [Pseudanabaena sp. FACHB-2040]|uniref:glycine oxidase ThiO n=1 Tax=Pseudanabaena sp. FACHB-2040 TaxID=2692859 RepID=UPI001682191E|nr:glycine oxidase ThiO [Pseudanabaena sp. FACHB-2040]